MKVKLHDVKGKITEREVVGWEEQAIYHLRRMITCLGEHLENEAERKNVKADELCPCLSELKKAQLFLKTRIGY